MKEMQNWNGMGFEPSKQFHACVQDTLSKLQAEHLQEETNMKKGTFRAVLIACALLISMMGVALAAGNLLGWDDLANRSGTFVPEVGKRVMQDSETYSFTLGNMRYDVKEMLCDGHIATASVHISQADGSSDLICTEPFDPVGACGENGKRLAASLGLDPSVTWVDAAKQLNKKLYRASAQLNVPVEYWADGGLSDALWNEDGSMVYYTMWFLNGKMHGEKQEMHMDLYLSEMNLENGEEENRQMVSEEITMILEAPMDICEYSFPEGTEVKGYRLESLKGELTAAGLYLFSTFTAPEGHTMNDFYQVYDHEYHYTNEEGERYANGISFSGSLDLDQFPKIVIGDMISVNEMPESMVFHIMGAEIPLTK